MAQVVLAILVIIGIFVMSAYNRPLYQSMLIGSFIMGFSQRLLTGELPLCHLASLFFNATTVNLLVAAIIISIMSNLMEKNGILDKLVDSVCRALGSFRTAIVVVPALVGAIPFSGGAIVSAPLVDNIGNKLSLPIAKRSAINLYFRHVWGFVAPYRTNMILASSLLFIDMSTLIKIQFPLMIIMLLVGLWFIILKIKAVDTSAIQGIRLKHFVVAGLLSAPLMIPMLLLLIFRQIPLSIAMLVGLFIAIYISRHELAWASLFNDINWKLVANVASILIFSIMIRQISGLYVLLESLIDIGLPMALVTFVFPLMIGFISGNSFATVGITYPILFNILPDGKDMLGYVLFMSTGVFLGYFISPIHLCQLLSNEYFKVSLVDTYREYVRPLVVFTLFSFLWIIIIYGW